MFYHHTNPHVKVAGRKCIVIVIVYINPWGDRCVSWSIFKSRFKNLYI